MSKTINLLYFKRKAQLIPKKFYCSSNCRMKLTNFNNKLKT